jgi:hypothetical protein
LLVERIEPRQLLRVFDLVGHHLFGSVLTVEITA